MMMRLTADDVETQSLPAGIVPRRGRMALSAADTCKQGQRAWTWLAPAPSASAVVGGVGWYGRTATQKTPAEQQLSSPTGIDLTGTVECRRGWVSGWRFRSPAASERETLPACVKAKGGNSRRSNCSGLVPRYSTCLASLPHFLWRLIHTTWRMA